MTTRSTSSSDSVTVIFQNSGSETFEAFWVDFEGNEESYFDLPPNTEEVTDTFLSHVWVFRSDKSVKIFMATKDTVPDSKIEITKLESELMKKESVSPKYEMPKMIHTPLEKITLPKGLKSSNGKAVVVSFSNLSSDDLDMFWVDYTGNLSKYDVLKAGAWITSDSYISHPFVFKQGKTVVGYHVVDGTRTVTVGRKNMIPCGYPINNETETSCHEILIKYPRAGRSNLGFIEDQSMFTELYNHLQDCGKQFIDEEFPPQQNWSRVTHIFLNTECVLYKSGIVPQDVIQGEIGNCWLMQSLSGAAMQPEKIKELFKYTIESKQGLYIVRLYFDKEVACILVDDYLPLNESGEIKYSRMLEPGELWGMILEKAMAKLDGCYENLEAEKTHNSPSIALAYILGGVPKCVDIRKPEQQKLIKENRFWQSWEEKRKRNTIIVCSSNPLPEGTDVADNGLVDFHGYSILDIRHFGSVMLLRVRNTWGGGEWRGRWSDESTEWQKYPMIRKELENEGLYEKKDDGIFWMEANDFLEHFCLLWWNEL